MTSRIKISYLSSEEDDSPQVTSFQQIVERTRLENRKLSIKISEKRKSYQGKQNFFNWQMQKRIQKNGYKEMSPKNPLLRKKSLISKVNSQLSSLKHNKELFGITFRINKNNRASQRKSVLNKSSYNFQSIKKNYLQNRQKKTTNSYTKKEQFQRFMRKLKFQEPASKRSKNRKK